MKSLNLNCKFNLEHTLFCGQAFRWEKLSEWSYGVVGDRILKLRQQGSKIYYISSNGITEDEIARYFGFDLDLEFVLKEIERDKNIHSAILYCKGLRILKQDFWETFATYILSSYNNIPRIRRMVYSLSKRFGREIFLDGYKNYTFPKVEKIASAKESELCSCGLGFRSSYLKKSAIKFLKKGSLFSELISLDYERAKERLLQFDGVGEKVADCIMLFGLSRLDAFPVDVWIKKGIENLYFKAKPLSIKKINEFGRNYFGNYAGYAQEYLYHYFRNRGTNAEHYTEPTRNYTPKTKGCIFPVDFRVGSALSSA